MWHQSCPQSQQGRGMVLVPMLAFPVGFPITWAVAIKAQGKTSLLNQPAWQGTVSKGKQEPKSPAFPLGLGSNPWVVQMAVPPWAIGAACFPPSPAQALLIQPGRQGPLS